jgi:hypothetical protein
VFGQRDALLSVISAPNPARPSLPCLGRRMTEAAEETAATRQASLSAPTLHMVHHGREVNSVLLLPPPSGSTGACGMYPTFNLLPSIKTGRQADRQTDGRMDGQIDSQTDRQTDRQIDSQTDRRHTDRQTFRHTDGQTDGRTD